jgi:cob(I)alamin adenosyltransferase
MKRTRRSALPACTPIRRHGRALQRISNDLFDLGADLCTPDRHLDETLSYTPLRMIEGAGRGWSARST